MPGSNVLRIGIFHTKCHLDEHLMLNEEQHYLLIVGGKLARINLKDCALDSNMAPNLATNTVLCVNGINGISGVILPVYSFSL